MQPHVEMLGRSKNKSIFLCYSLQHRSQLKHVFISYHFPIAAASDAVVNRITGMVATAVINCIGVGL